MVLIYNVIYGVIYGLNSSTDFYKKQSVNNNQSQCEFARSVLGIYSISHCDTLSFSVSCISTVFTVYFCNFYFFIFY